MARKKIREHQAKRLLREHLKRLANLDLEIVSVLIDENSDLNKLAIEHNWLNGKLVVKPDMLFGQRGKHNLVLLNATLEQVKNFIAEKMGKEIQVNNAIGILTHFIIEPFIPHKEEYYLSIVSNRENTTVLFSNSGGIDIEEHWDQVAKIEVPTFVNLKDIDLTIFRSQIPESIQSNVINFVCSVFNVFEDLDFNLIEINPFAVDSNANCLPLDLVAEIDTTARFKNQRKWGNLDFPHPFGRRLYPEEKFVQQLDEKTGASLKLTVLNPSGRIWNLVAGGGASVIFADTVADLGYGTELGNYGEYSGAPNEEETYHYAKTLIDLATRNPDGSPRALLIGGGIANFTDVARTFKGIIHALKEYKQKLQQANVKIFVRRAGPNYQTGLKLMRSVGQEIGIEVQVFGPEVPMTHIVPLAVEWIKSNPISI
eukprot:TRINITY_DN6494_c0_g3_i1.p1 TRINITY_DN6494_c0_g3~~TRINITY_DN6494_c0_g3_i1.p1  ORF type:complete len:427 (+),score=239.36 TRINITY_DN6494_c0_g3_i1:51-1331(+)